MQTFTRKIEDFVCEHCGAQVIGDGYTNHCPKCLWSKHVDVFPGDRASECQGMMAPVEVFSGKEFSVLHECIVCGHQKKNKVSEEDDIDVLLSKK